MVQHVGKKAGKRSQVVSAKRQAILTVALDIFSQYGIHGTHLEQMAEQADVPETNLPYYYPSKEVLCTAVLRQILDIWLAPLKTFREDFAPLVAIKKHIHLKLKVSRDYSQTLRLLCMEILAEAPLSMAELEEDPRTLVDEKSTLIADWIRSRKLAPAGPHHLIFMIWASTQYYAGFVPQVEVVTDATLRDETFFSQMAESVQRMIIKGIRVRQLAGGSGQLKPLSSHYKSEAGNALHSLVLPVGH